MSDIRIKTCVLGQVSTNCYLVYDEQTKEGAVIDPADNAPYILNKCSELGINLTAVLLTHGHFDHIMAVPDVLRAFRVKVYAYETEENMLADTKLNMTGGFRGPQTSLHADVLLHAIMDALLGAAALGDIGKHFPDTDEKYRGISSIKLLEHVAGLLDDHDFIVENIDATIIAQRPKMRPYIDTMRKNIADVLRVGLDQINIKATTEEGLGFTGTGEGISSQAVCLLEKVINYSSFDVTPAEGNCGGCGGCAREN